MVSTPNRQLGYSLSPSRRIGIAELRFHILVLSSLLKVFDKLNDYEAGTGFYTRKNQ